MKRGQSPWLEINVHEIELGLKCSCSRACLMNLPCVLALVGGSHYQKKVVCSSFLHAAEDGLRSTFPLFREKITFAVEIAKKSHCKSIYSTPGH